MTTENEIRRVLHPEAHERLGDAVRPIGRGQPPLGCDQQGRYPQVAEPCVDLDELGVRVPEPEPLWPKIVGVIVAIIVIVAVFAPVGGGK